MVLYIPILEESIENHAQLGNEQLCLLGERT